PDPGHGDPAAERPQLPRGGGPRVAIPAGVGPARHLAARGHLARHAAYSRYCFHACGITGAATWMKIVGLGRRGGRRGCRSAWRGRRSPFRRLQATQQVTMFSQVDGPPFERGMTWSTVSDPRRLPQYWHDQRSRANTARRVIRRAWTSRGTLT